LLKSTAEYLNIQAG